MHDTPNTTGAVIARVRGWAGANGWSKSRYAALAGLRDTTLRGFHDADWNPNTETLQRLEALIPGGWQAGDPVPGAPPVPPAVAVAATTEGAPDRVVGEDSPEAPPIGTTPAVRPVVVSLAVLEEPAAQQGAEPATRHEGGPEPSPRHQESDPSHER